MRGSVFFAILSGILLAFVHSPVMAQEKRLPGPTLSEDGRPVIIVTTPSRLEEPVENTTGSVSIVTRPEIEVQNPVNAPEVLRDLTGVRLQESGTPGESAKLSLRGVERYQTLVMLDGIRLNSPFFGDFDLGDFLLEEIGQIEIVRGAQSALYGSDSIGGVVNLKSRRPLRPLEISMTASAGNEGTLREVVSVGGAITRLDYSLTFSRTDMAGQFDHDRFSASLFGGTLVLPVRQSGQVQFNYRFQDDRKELTSDSVSIAEKTVRIFLDKNNEMEKRLLLNALRYSDRWTSWLGFSGQVSWLDTDLDWNNPQDPGDPAEVNPQFFSMNLDTRTLILDLQQNIQVGESNTFSIGVERRWEWVDNTISIMGFSPPAIDQARRNMAYYLQHLYNREKQWTLQTGVRMDDSSVVETVVNPKVSSSYEFSSTKTKLRGGWGMGFRAPTVQEQFFPIFGNPELQPEKSRSWELGIRQGLMGGKVSMDTAFFWIDYSSLIQRSPAGVDNIGKARSRGVETVFEVRPSSVLTVRTNYTYLDAKNLSTGGALPFRSRHQGNVSLLYIPSVNLTLYLDINLVYRQSLSDNIFILPDGTTLQGQSPGFARVDLSGTYYLFRSFGGFREARFFVRIRNLFDQDYYDVPGFPAPGLGILGGLTVFYL